MNDKELWPRTSINTSLVFFSISAVVYLLGAGMSYVISLTPIGLSEDFPTPLFSLFMAACFFICIGLTMLRTRFVIYILIFMAAGLLVHGVLPGNDLRLSTLVMLGFFIWDVIKLSKKGELV